MGMDRNKSDSISPTFEDPAAIPAEPGKKCANEERNDDEGEIGPPAPVLLPPAGEGVGDEQGVV